MNEFHLVEILTPNESLALQELTEALVMDCNNRVLRLIKRLGLKKNLKIFNIAVAGMTLELEVNDEFVDEIKQRTVKEEVVRESPDYMI